MNMQRARFGSALLLSVTIAIGPVVQAADQGVIHLAAAIGVETTPAAPKPPAKSSVPAKKPVVAAKPEPPQEPTGMSTSTKIWIGAGVAAGLALLAGGGGGSSAATTHVPP